MEPISEVPQRPAAFVARLRCVLLLSCVVFLSACGGGDDEEAPREVPGLITISGGPTVSAIGISHFLGGERDGSVHTVRWSNSAGGSGLATLSSEVCVVLFFPVACNHRWRAEIPLAMGTNVVTVIGDAHHGEFGQATITITRVQ